MNNDHSNDMNTLMADTLGASMNFWGQMAASCSAPVMFPKLAENVLQNDAFTQGFIENPALAMFQVWTSNLLNLDSGGVETLTRKNRELWENFISAGTQGMDGLPGIGEFAALFAGDDTTRDLFSTFKTAAENVFGKFANIPQLGLTRSYQEKMLRVINKYNQFQSNMTDLGLLLHLPVKNAFAAVQKETAESLKNPADIKETYKRWVAILEQNFMILYKSPEFTRAMAKTLQAMEGYIKVRDDVVSDFLKMLPITTRKDAEGVYKDIYELKKKVRKLEKMSAAAA